MKSNYLLVLACLASAPSFSQTLPDEINSAPYEVSYRNLSVKVGEAQRELAQSRSDLSEAERFIREMNAHILGLQNSIREFQYKINQNERAIPGLQRDISNLRQEQSRLESEIRRMQGEESRLQARHQEAIRDLRPLEENIRRKEQVINALQNELSQNQRAEREATSRLSRTQAEIATLDRSIADENARQRQLQNDLRSIESKIAALESTRGQLEGRIREVEAKLTSERAKLAALNNRVEQYRQELARLRAENAPADQIKDAERKVSASSSARDNTAREIQVLESQVSGVQAEIRNNRSKVEELRRDQTTLPSRIALSVARERQFATEKNGKAAELVRLQSDLNQIQRNITQLGARIMAARNDLRNDEASVMRQRQLISELVRSIEGVRVEISSSSSRQRATEQQIVQATRRMRELENEIPQLEAQIRQSENDISRGRQELAQAEADEARLRQQIASQEAELSRLTSARDTAESQMTVRVNLYNRYNAEAQDLGISQTAVATGMGEKEGLKLASSSSRKNGQGMGAELGGAEAKHWGYVRGEIEGYDAGHSAGMASPEDRARAFQDGQSKGKQNAHLFAQTNFKPAFFEEFVLEEFKRPLEKMSGTKPKVMAQKPSFKEMRLPVQPLTPQELARSGGLSTPLDQSIANFSRDVKNLEGKARRLADAQVAFEAPSKIPWGAANCQQVYKGLAVFQASCEASYRDSFAALYVQGAKRTFEETYTASYEAHLSAGQVERREAAYPAEYKAASAVGHAEGLRVGKEEIYAQVFSETYRQSYEEELPSAREKSKADAKTELAGFLAAKPLLTLATSKLAAENFRGGEEVEVAAAVKNVGRGELSAPAIVRITQVENAEVLLKESVLNAAAPLSVTPMPSLKIKVSETAHAGERIVVRGIVELPGDLYRGSRTEKFELSQVLAANPTSNLDLSYDRTPDIRGVFRRKIHYLSATISPKVEDMPAGYELTISSKGPNAELIEFKSTSFKTGALKAGEEKELNFSYTFPDAAKYKPISLEIAVIFNGKVVRTEAVELTPR